MLIEFLISLLICSFVIGIAYIAFWQSLKWKRAAKSQNNAIEWPNTAISISGGIFEGSIIALLPSIVAIADHFTQGSFHAASSPAAFSAAHSRPTGRSSPAQIECHARRPPGRRICPKRRRVKGLSASLRMKYRLAAKHQNWVHLLGRREEEGVRHRSGNERPGGRESEPARAYAPHSERASRPQSKAAPRSERATSSVRSGLVRARRAKQSSAQWARCQYLSVERKTNRWEVP